MPRCERNSTSEVTRPSAERLRAGWMVLAALGCFLALAAPFFALRIYVADDLGEFHLPVRNFYAEQLQSGESFDWMPSLYGGFYVAGEGQLGGYHPWHLLLYRFLPLGAAFDVELLASYPLLFAGTYMLFMRLIGRRDAALFGALTFTFGGFSLLHFVHPNAIAVVAHLPWLLWTSDVALRTTSGRARIAAEAGFALLLGSQLLLGYPQYVWFSMLAVVALVAWRLVCRDARTRRVASLALAGMCGVLIGAVQWLATWHLLRESVRQVSDTGFANNGSLAPLNLVQLVAPYLLANRVVGQNTHELGLYAGAVTVVLCVWLLANRSKWGELRPLVRALLVFTAVAFVLAAGEFGGLYRLQAWVPLANRFRFPCRAIVLVQLGMAGLAAVAAAILFSRRDRADDESNESNPRASGPLFLVFAAAVAMAILGPLIWPQYVAAPLVVWTGPLLIGLAAALVALVQRGTRGAVALLAIFAAVDLSCYGLSYSVYGRTADMHEFVEAIRRPPQGQARVVAPSSKLGLRTGDRMLLAGLTRVDGYAGLEPARTLDYSNPRTWQLAGAAWAWQSEPDQSEPDQSEPDQSDEGRRWVPISPTAPRARLITQVAIETPGDSPIIAWHAARVEPAVDLAASDPGTCRVIEDRPGHITIDVTTPARQVLATTESFDPGWRVRVDGMPSTVVRVDGDFLGCLVSGGNHRVQFEFRPRARWLGVLLSGCGLGLLVSIIGFRLSADAIARRRGGR